jgi:PAS domain S-box-containing protein
MLSVEILKQALDMAHVGVWILDETNGKFIISDEVLEIYGLKAGTQFKTPEDMIEAVVYKDDRAHVHTFLNAIRRGEKVHVTFRGVRSDGVQIWLHVSPTESYKLSKDDETDKIIGIIQDITEQHKLQEQLQHAQKLEAIATLAGGLAHDLNNVFMAIVGLSTFIERESSEEEIRQYAANIVKASIGGGDRTRSLLSFARKMPVNKKHVNILELLEEVNALLKSSIPRDIEVKTYCDKDICIYGDYSGLLQSVINVSLNAVDSMKGDDIGELVFSARVINLDDSNAGRLKSGSYVCINVSDTGSGISKDIINKVFNPFFTTKKIGEGTGLGLSMVYATVNDHGGDTRISSEVGIGTDVVIYLPINEVASDLCKKSDASKVILLVDDELIVVGIVKKILEIKGYKVIAATNGKMALDIFKQIKPDLVILDLAMPVMDGFTTFVNIRIINPNAKVIVFTGSVNIEQVQQLLDNGAVGWIQKPSMPVDIVRHVSTVLED